MAVCNIQPISAFQSTNLNSQITSYSRLGDRILRQLGYPLVTVELHPDQLNENISIAVDLFTKFAGYTKEYLIFDSNLYHYGKGIKLDDLFSLVGSLGDDKTLTPQSNFTVNNNTSYVTISVLPSSLFSGSTALSSLSADVPPFQVINSTTYNAVVSYNSALSSYFQQSKQYSISELGTQVSVSSGYQNMFDYDVMDYRKVIDIVDFEEGSTTGINTLFTLEQTLAQQTYFSYALGNYGFDLVSWYTLKEWIKDREKILAIKRTWKFDEYTQYLQFYPQPKSTSRFYGVISCYVERPIRDIIKQPWVQQYALALSKIAVGRARGKFSSVQLLGGGTLNYADVLAEGLAEKKELEQQLYTGATPGNEALPTMFIVG